MVSIEVEVYRAVAIIKHNAQMPENNWRFGSAQTIYLRLDVETVRADIDAVLGPIIIVGPPEPPPGGGPVPVDYSLPIFLLYDGFVTNTPPDQVGGAALVQWVSLNGGATLITLDEYYDIVGAGDGNQMSIIPVEVVVGYVTSNWGWIVTALKALGKIFVLDSVVEWLQGTGGEGITNLDDIVARIFSSPGGQPIGQGGVVTDVNPDAPSLYPVGHIRQGWKIKKITTYVIPEGGRRTVKTSKKVWHKDYNFMSFVERAAKFQGQRAQAYESRQAKNSAYIRGFNNGAKAQQSQEKTVEAGGTALVTYSRRR